MENENLFQSELRLFQKVLGDIQGKRVLSVGCGSGLFESMIDCSGIEGIEPSRDMGAIAEKRGVNVVAFGAIEDVELEENAYDVIYLNGSSSYMENLTRAFDVCKKALKPNGTFISLDVPKESAFGFMYLLAKEVGTFDHPFLNGVMPKLPYPHELCCAGVWHSTEEKIDVLKALGFHDFDFYQTLLKNPMYTNESVEVFRYVTENTFDAYMWQTIESKQKFISQIMTSKSPVRSCEDIDETALSYAEVKALATGNPYIKEKMDLEIDVSRLKLLKANYQSQKYAMEDKLLKHFPREVKRTEECIAGYKADIALHKQHKTEDFPGMVLCGVNYAEKKDAGIALIETCKAQTSPEPREVGSYRGFTLLLSYDTFGKTFQLTLKGTLSHTIDLGSDIHGNIQRMENVLEVFPARLNACEQALANLHIQIENAKAEMEKPFTQEDELKIKSARLAELDSMLNMDKRENDTLDAVPEQEEKEHMRRYDRER